MSGILNQFFGGGQQKQEYEDFVSRFDKGAPWDGISDQEALDRYNQVAPHLPADEYERSAEQAFAQLTPEQRREFGLWLQQRGQQNGLAISGGGSDLHDPRQLAQMTSRMHQKQPDLLSGLLGGMLGGGSQRSGGSDLLSNPIAKAALAGVTAMAAKRLMGGR